MSVLCGVAAEARTCTGQAPDSEERGHLNQPSEPAGLHQAKVEGWAGGEYIRQKKPFFKKTSHKMSSGNVSICL